MGRAPTPEQVWQSVLVDGSVKLKGARRLFRHVPSAPRCKMCNNPFGGVGGRVFRLWGQVPSKMNPNLCASCCDALPVGGLEVDIAVLFADVRGSTSLGEHSDPTAFAERMNRFYRTATTVLVKHDALIDKLIGDEVMALFIPGIAGPDYRRRSVEAALDLLRSVGYGTAEGPWLDLGVGVNAGVAYVGNVGGEGVVDFTALGDPVNVAARLQGIAEGGHLVVSADVAEDAGALLDPHEAREVTLRGRDAPMSVLVRAL